MSSAPKSVLVTGACGFLGGHIVSTCVNEAQNVIAVDRLASRQTVPEGVRVLTTDVASPEFKCVARDLQPEVIIHAAGPASVGASMEDPAANFHDGIDPWLSVLEAVRCCSARTQVIFVSSAAVYGQPDTRPIREDSPLRPISPYGYHKRIAEDLLREYYQVYGIRGCILRVFSAYGPGLCRQVLHDICVKALKQPTVVLSGTGEESRDFIHVRDVAAAVCAVARYGSFEAGVYNVASGEETTILSLAKALVGALGLHKPICFTGRQRQGDPLRWQADIACLRALGYEPRVSLVEGVNEYAKWITHRVCGEP